MVSDSGFACPVCRAGALQLSITMRFPLLDDPEVAIDTNHLERALRPIPLGKRNPDYHSS